MIILIQLYEDLEWDGVKEPGQIWYRLKHEGTESQPEQMERIWSQAEEILGISLDKLKEACIVEDPIEAGQAICRTVGVQMEGYELDCQAAVSNLADEKTDAIRRAWPTANRMITDQLILTLAQLQGAQYPYATLEKARKGSFANQKDPLIQAVWKNLKALLPEGTMREKPMSAKNPKAPGQLISEKLSEGKIFGDIIPTSELIKPPTKDQVIARIEERNKMSNQKLLKDPRVAFYYLYILSYLDLWPLVTDSEKELETVKNGLYSRKSDDEKLVWKEMFRLVGLSMSSLGRLNSEQGCKNNGKKVLAALGGFSHYFLN